MSETLYVIWSEEHGRWWRYSGYTYSLEEAARFTKEQADKIVKEGNLEIIPETGVKGDRTFNEIAIPDPLCQPT